MDKKGFFTILGTIMFFLIILSSSIPDNFILNILSNLGVISFCIFLAFELLFKNNVYLLAGMSKEDSKKIEIQKKYRKLTFILGIIFLLIGIYAIIEIYNYMDFLGLFNK